MLICYATSRKLLQLIFFLFIESAAIAEDVQTKKMIFKNQDFIHSIKSAAAANKKTRYWKSLKQVITMERSLFWPSSSSNYSSIDAPPSFHPPKKYSDISGLPASYTDPQTKLRYSTSDEFSRIRTLPADIINGYLTLRKVSPAVP